MKPVQAVCAFPRVRVCLCVWQPSRQSGTMLPLYQTTAVDAKRTSAARLKGRQEGARRSTGGEKGGWWFVSWMQGGMDG